MAGRGQAFGQCLRRLHAFEQGIRAAPVGGDISEARGRTRLEHRLAELSAGFPEVTRYTRVGPDVPALPATSEELAEACEAAFRPALGAPPHIVGLDRHGVVAVGKTPWEAFEHVERLEHICRIALAAGQPLGHAQGARHAHAR